MECAECGKEMIYKEDHLEKKYNGKTYKYSEKKYECPECGDHIWVENFENEIYSEVNRKIREDNGMLQPEEITRQRIALGIGERDFWNRELKQTFRNWVSYHFIELGTLQTKQEDDAIRTALKSIKENTAGQRTFPLWMFGWDYRNELEPKRLFWAIEKLCLNNPTTEMDLYKKLAYFDGKTSNYTGALYNYSNKEFYIDKGAIILDYMVNVLGTLRMQKFVGGVRHYSSEKEPEYDLAEDGIVADEKKEIQDRVELLEKLRNTDKFKLVPTIRTEDYYSRTDVYHFFFKDIFDENAEPRPF